MFAYLQPEYSGYSPISGPVLQDPPGSRADVLSFLSAPFREETLIAGSIKVSLDVESDAADTAFTVKIVEMRPDGTAYNIRNSITSLAYRNGASSRQPYLGGTVVTIALELKPITWKLQTGYRLRPGHFIVQFP